MAMGINVVRESYPFLLNISLRVRYLVRLCGLLLGHFSILTQLLDAAVSYSLKVVER